MTLYIFRGLPGCGKSTKAREMQSDQGGLIAERDAIRMALFGRYTDVNEDQVTAVQDSIIEYGLSRKQHVYVPDMNLRNQYVTRLYKLAWKHNTDVEVIDMTDVSVEDCLARNMSEERIASGKVVPQNVITINYQKHVKGKGYPLPVMMNGAKMARQKREKYVPDFSKPDAVIVDLDGTLAEMVGRGPFDEHLVLTDKLREEVACMVEHAAFSDCTIIFMSGRTDGCYDDTLTWLKDKLYFLNGWDVQWELHMRRAVEDRGRPDDDVKYDLFMREVASRFNVLYAIDDRNKVVKMWREIGITCAQVAEGDF